jgi:hypothetical protein
MIPSPLPADMADLISDELQTKCSDRPLPRRVLP